MGKRPRLAKFCGLYWQRGREHPEPWELVICACRDAHSAPLPGWAEPPGSPSPRWRGVLRREARGACPPHDHPSSPTILSLWRAVSMLTCSSHTASTNIARAAPNPDHTLFSRLCLCLHLSRLASGTVQTACSALSPAPCFPVTRSTSCLPVLGFQECVFDVLCLASANCLFPSSGLKRQW